MSLNASPSSERLHIGFFGIRNAGKSSLVNAITNQSVSLVSDIKGTTTDPVKKAMELLPIGPVVIIDTPGFDDSGTLGEMRVQKTREILKKTDFAVLVVDITKGLSEYDEELVAIFETDEIPYITVFNKSDLLSDAQISGDNVIKVSTKNEKSINLLKEKIAEAAAGIKKEKLLLDDLINQGDTVILVTPIDESAPKGRLILPQQLVLRNILDNNCTAIVCKETELADTLNKLSLPPKLVVTDSQVFSTVSKILPESVKLTSFSIILARYKGDLYELVKGAAALSGLNDGDTVLISEGCTHHRQCNDIGTVKMPCWIKNYTGKNIKFEFTSGGDFVEKPEDYALIVHCGGCMLGDKEMESRIKKARRANVPIVNYGVAIAMMHGILKRSLEVFPEILQLIEGG